MSHVEQRHRDAARAWLGCGNMVVYADVAEDVDALARLLADTERAALDRAAAECQSIADGHLKAERGARDSIDATSQHIAFIGANACANAIRALAAAPTTEDRT